MQSVTLNTRRLGKQVRCRGAARAGELGAEAGAEPGGAVTSLSLQTPPEARARGPSRDLSCIFLPMALPRTGSQVTAVPGQSRQTLPGEVAEHLDALGPLRYSRRYGSL